MNKRLLLILVTALCFSLQTIGQKNYSAEELIKKFNENYLDCDKESFINWICNNYDTKPEDFV